VKSAFVQRAVNTTLRNLLLNLWQGDNGDISALQDQASPGPFPSVLKSHLPLIPHVMIGLSQQFPGADQVQRAG
jgi:hypothetical protein